MNVNEFKNICRAVFPDCYIHYESKKLPIVDMDLWRDGPHIAYFWGDKCVAWHKNENVCTKCDWTPEEFEALLKSIKKSYGK